MDSELRSLYICVSIGLTVLALLLVRFTGNHSVFIMLGVLFLLGSVLAFFGAVLLRWHKNILFTDFIKCLAYFFVIPCAVACILNYGILNPLWQHGYLTLKNVLIFTILAVVITLYVLRFEKYKWKTFLICEENRAIELLNVSIYGLEGINSSLSYFLKKPELYDFDRIAFMQKSSKSYEYQKVGMPALVDLLYYSRREQKYYSGEFELPLKKVKSLMGYSVMYPLTNIQNFDQFSIKIKKEGKVSFLLGTMNRELSVLNATCVVVDKKDISPSHLEKIKLDSFKIKQLSQEEEIARTSISKGIDSLSRKKFIIKHRITGLSKQVKSIDVITASGEYYSLDKKLWNSRRLRFIDSPPICIRYHIIKKTGQEMLWEYTYDAKDITEKTKSYPDNTELEYRFSLFINEENLYRGNSFEYINGKKEEFKMGFGSVKYVASNEY